MGPQQKERKDSLKRLDLTQIPGEERFRGRPWRWPRPCRRAEVSRGRATCQGESLWYSISTKCVGLVSPGWIPSDVVRHISHLGLSSQSERPSPPFTCRPQWSGSNSPPIPSHNQRLLSTSDKKYYATVEMTHISLSLSRLLSPKEGVCIGLNSKAYWYIVPPYNTRHCIML